MMRRYFGLSCLLVLCLTSAASAASFTNTDKAFLATGAASFVGEVSNVQVLSSDGNTESGIVQLTVTNAVSGGITATSISLAYQRTLAPADEEGNWDLIQPVHTSLKAVVGKKLLVFVTNTNGTYTLAQASNAVQDATQGLLVGRIRDRREESPDYRADELEVEVVEMIFGWTSSPVITMPFGLQHSCTEVVGPIQRVMSNEDPLSLGMKHGGQLYIVAFNQGGFCGAQTASKEFLEELKALDSPLGDKLQ